MNCKFKTPLKIAMLNYDIYYERQGKDFYTFEGFLKTDKLKAKKKPKCFVLSDVDKVFKGDENWDDLNKALKKMKVTHVTGVEDFRDDLPIEMQTTSNEYRVVLPCGKDCKCPLFPGD